MKVLKCTKCGNMVMELKKGTCDIMCCGEAMKELVPGETDGAHEKHVPAVTVEGSTVKVAVGEVEHPMMDNHYIEFIALETNQGVAVKALKPNEKPAAEFTMAEGEVAQAAYEHCNLHGFWKKEI